jgi:hypothetical protein
MMLERQSAQMMALADVPRLLRLKSRKLVASPQNTHGSALLTPASVHAKLTVFSTPSKNEITPSMKGGNSGSPGRRGMADSLRLGEVKG